MKQTDIEKMIANALARAQETGSLPSVQIADIPVERPQNPYHGDFATSLPMRLTKQLRMSPFDIAEILVSHIDPTEAIERVFAIQPGFVNFSLNPKWIASQVKTVLDSGNQYGDSDLGIGKRVQIEFVSVNPTGPLHAGHARGAVFGSALANILEATGFDVQREYYLNDAGNQMDLFNLSLLARYKQHTGQDSPIPEGGYHGEYMVKLAEELGETLGSELEDLDEDNQLTRLGQAGLERIVETLREDLTEIRVNYDQWFSEKSLFENGQYKTIMDILNEGCHITHREGAIWFTSSALGDDKDKVLVRSTGAPTYFASDVAYHYNKLVERGFDFVINVWGADHQGHAPFMKAMISALGIPQERLEILIYQLVTLKRGDQTVRLSKRAGDLITLHDLVTEVGPDACRYFFLTRSPDSQMDFDLDLAKKETPENPVFYIQYAHARTSSILRLAKEHGLDYRDGQETLLIDEAEQNLIRKILLLPEIIELMSNARQPHHLPHYAHDLATSVHSFYEKCRVMSNVPEDLPKTKARLKLVKASLVVLSKCLKLMSMSAPHRM